MAEAHLLGPRKDLVATPLFHDAPAELSQPRVRDWHKGEVEPVPGKTVPGLTVITRDYPNVHKMFTSIGPLLRESTIGVKGAVWKPAPELELLGKKLHRVTEPGISYGMPSLQRSEDVADAILALAPETNGSAAVRAWEQLEKRSGLDLTHLSEGKEAVRIDFVVKPTRMMGGYAYMAYDSNYYGST